MFEFGYNNRTTEFTNLNEHSSRSHALLIVTVRGVDCSTGLRTTGERCSGRSAQALHRYSWGSADLPFALPSGKLNLVDLAGSERVGKSGAEGNRLREAQHINRSLSALGDVIAALRSRQGHVPFRNSKLTYLLQDSLSGDSKTLMVVQVRAWGSGRASPGCPGLSHPLIDLHQHPHVSTQVPPHVHCSQWAPPGDHAATSSAVPWGSQLPWVGPELSVPQVSPVEKNTSETLYSLKFAERVRSVELGPGSRRTELGSWSSQEHLEVLGDGGRGGLGWC